MKTPKSTNVQKHVIYYIIVLAYLFYAAPTIAI